MTNQDLSGNEPTQREEQPAPADETPKQRRRPRSFNERIGEAELLAEAMDRNKDDLSVRGGGEEFVNLLKTEIQAAKDINTEQEENKAKLKDSTRVLGEKMNTLDRLVGDGRKIVKMVINQKRWVEFGIKVTQ